jgi:cytochrome P450
MAVSKGQRLPSLFSTTDESYHANLRRSVNSAFSMSALVQYEPFVDEVTRVFLDQTERAGNKVCNFAEWLQYYAFDVIGQITYSRRHGFVDRAEDVDGMIAYLGKLFSYVAPVSTLYGLTKGGRLRKSRLVKFHG